MRKILILTAVIMIAQSMSCTEKEDLFSISGDGIITVNQGNVPQKMSAKAQERPQDNKCKEVAVFNVGKAEYTLKIGNRWPIHDSPGDYDIIQFYKDGEEKLYFEDGEWLVKYTDSQNPNSHVSDFAAYAANPYFINIPLSETAAALVFMGPSYPTNPSRMVIFVLTENDIKMVLNQELEAEGITATAKSFKMQVASKRAKLVNDSPEKWTEAELHNIWLENGILKLK